MTKRAPDADGEGESEKTDSQLPALQVEPPPDPDAFDESPDTTAGAEPFQPADDPGLGDGGARPPEEPAAFVPVPDAGERLPSILESLLLAADRPLSAADLGQLVGERSLEKIELALGGLQQHYDPRGIQLHNVAGGWQLRTQPQNAPWVQKLLAQKPVRLTRSQLETLAIVGYRQPITRPEIDEIRGVDSGGTLKTLLDRQLVRILGKKEEPGRPLLYGTTKEFLEFFNLRDLKDLPTLREFHELSEEHQAQVAALEEKAPPGTIIDEEPQVAPPIVRSELPDEPLEEDLAAVSALIDGASAKAQAAASAIAADQAPPPEEPPADPPPPAGDESQG